MGSNPETSSISVRIPSNGAKTLLVWTNSLKSPAIAIFACLSKAKMDLMNPWVNDQFLPKKSHR